MSTYGGDSWVPAAMHRKQQVDQVLADAHQLDQHSNHWRRLSNGRIACLVCPRCPVLDTLPMLVIHRKGKKHQAAALKYEENDFRLQNEIQKRTALEACKAAEEVRSTQKRSSSLASSSALLSATRKRSATAFALQDDSTVTATAEDGSYAKQKVGHGPLDFSTTPSQQAPTCPVKSVTCSTHPAKQETAILCKRKQVRKRAELEVVTKEVQDRRHERERLLRLREAGWRLDGNGKWFRDESVEFDSDEEVPADLA